MEVGVAQTHVSDTESDNELDAGPGPGPGPGPAVQAAGVGGAAVAVPVPVSQTSPAELMAAAQSAYDWIFEQGNEAAATAATAGVEAPVRPAPTVGRGKNGKGLGKGRHSVAEESGESDRGSEESDRDSEEDEDQAGQSSKRIRDDDGRASENEHLPGEMEKLRKINSQLEKRLEARDEQVQSLRAHITAFQARIDVLVVYEGQILDRRKRRQEATEANSVDLTGCDGEEAGAATGAPRH